MQHVYVSPVVREYEKRCQVKSPISKDHLDIYSLLTTKRHTFLYITMSWRHGHIILLYNY